MPDQSNPAAVETSSAKPLFPEKQEGMFREALTVLNECAVPYAVSGAFALQRHTGIWRCTKDLDVFLMAENVPTALRCLEAHGFNCEVPDPVWLAKAHRDGFYIDLITGMSNAVITVEHTWIDRSQPAVIAGVKTRVLYRGRKMTSTRVLNPRAHQAMPQAFPGLLLAIAVRPR